VQHAICLSGNIPVFVDSVKDSWNMDLNELERAITEKTKAIVVTHLFGYPMDVIKVQELVRQAEEKYGHKIYVIQDVAHSFGARWNGDLVTKYGDASIFGMNVSKILNSVFGGMVITNNKQYAEELRTFRTDISKGNRYIKSVKRILYHLAIRVSFNSIVYGFVNWLERKKVLDRFVKYYEDDRIYFPNDWDSPVTNTEASVGRVQLLKYDEIIDKRRSVALEYKAAFETNDEVHFMNDLPGATYSHCVALVDNREAWLEKYSKQGMQLGILIEYSVPEMKAFNKFKTKEYPQAAYYMERSINFPNWPGVKVKVLE